MPRHLLRLSDVGPEGLVRLLDAADRFQAARGEAGAPRPLAGKTIALVFEKASTRTRVSLEIAVAELGGHPLVLLSAGSQMARGEPLSDTTRVLTRMVHAITLRTSGDERLEEMVRHATVPVLNALSEGGHPLQLLADLQTVRRRKGELGRLRYAWVGDGNNVASSWVEAAGLLGLDLTLATPAGYEPPAKVLEEARARGGRVRVVRDPAEAARGADVLSTDVFASMGQEADAERRREAFRDYQVDRRLVAQAAPGAIVLHCLPAHRGEEIEAELLEDPASAIWEQAEARLHTAKAALVWALELDD